MEQTKYLVVGSSHAALEAVTAIRMHDPEGSLTLLTRDPHLPEIGRASCRERV